MRLEPESPNVFQDSIKQLQNSNNEFEDEYNHIHDAHTRLLLVKRSTMLAYLSAACCQHLD
ncbi:hypothetical protein NS31R_09055 [Enterobacter cancerogenus]|nr:hypothetical protein NS104_13510 [Enterobacter cancerogenus]KTQ53971.1 hypothetical protein NS111_03270 [Enterobacter cancerogenus]KTQ75475.1 hypothetical protein NS188_01355 [Enterobacter cancerogenus]KTQ82466.1 hypothetical protein NS31R_09055 [Enterobacter cancerogenus]